MSPATPRNREARPRGWFISASARGDGSTGLTASADLTATGAAVGTGSIGFVSTAARANSELPNAAEGRCDGVAADPGFAVASSVIARRAASPVLFKEAVLSRSRPVVSPPHPERDAAIRTAAMRDACTIRLRHYLRTHNGGAGETHAWRFFTRRR